MGLGLFVVSGCGTTSPSGDGQSVDPGTLPSDVEVPGGDDPVESPDVPDPVENEAPVADAGPDQSVTEGESVTLDGTASRDPDGDELTYSWSAEGDSPIPLSEASNAVVGFLAPDVDADVVLRFTLRVSDAALQAEDSIEVLVRARLNPASFGPQAAAGPDQSAPAGAVVTLDGTASESGGGGLLAFEWFQTAGTPVTLNDPTQATTTFTAPSSPTSEELVFELTVFEGELADVDEVTVTVAAAVVEQPPTGGGPPPGPGPGPTDNCPNDPSKTEPGVCGCGVPDTDTDGDGTANCVDGCPNNAPKTTPGVCGCAAPDTDSDGDGTANCVDACPSDPAKIAPGLCGCGVADADSDGDGVANCTDGCPSDPAKTSAGQCGCGAVDTDTDGDSVADCVDGCPLDPTTSNSADCGGTVGGDDQSDWDLVMLRLVNRARLDPAGEASRLGSSVVDSRAPVPPLAYDRATGLCATNHNTWMHLNLGAIASGRTPDSFTHYETLDGNSTGTPASSTPGYTGATLGSRMTAAGMVWGSVGENILTAYSSNPIAVDLAKMTANHKGWWESTGHRNNMLSTSYTSFGHHAEAQAFVPPRGGLNSPVDNILFATENFARPLATPRTYVFGVLYEDLDSSGAWTPHDVGDPMREGLVGVSFTVRVAGTATIVTSDTTMDNGAFSAKVADGTYDVVFTASSLPGGTLTIPNVVISGSNVDVGDWEAGP